MKSHFFHFSLVLFFTSLLFGCQEPDPIEITPDATPYAGKCTGNTSQMTYIELDIRQINFKQMLYKATFNFWEDTTLKYRILTGEQGLCRIKRETIFVELPDHGYIIGTFHNQNHLSGKIKVLSDENYKELYFDVTHADSSVTIHSLSRARFTARDTTWEYNQVINDLFPISRVIQTDTVIIIETGIRIEKGMNIKRDVFLFKAGIFNTVEEVASFFVPGHKQYAPMDKGGVEHIFFDPQLYLREWSSAWGSKSQQGSYFNIIEIQKIPHFEIEPMQRLKILVKFDCYVYNPKGDTLQISDGFFLGFVDLPL